MPGRHLLHLSSRATARSIAALAALVVLLTTSAASAAPAPMCDEHAQSIAAPFPLFPSHDGEARTGRPCKGKGRYELGRAPAPEREQPQSAPFDGVERAPPVAEFKVMRDRGRAEPPRDAERAAACPGFCSDVFRPPRSA